MAEDGHNATMRGIAKMHGDTTAAINAAGAKAKEGISKFKTVSGQAQGTFANDVQHAEGRVHTAVAAGGGRRRRTRRKRRKRRTLRKRRKRKTHRRHH